MEEISQETRERYMKMALQEAQAAFDAGEVPVGAVVVHRNSTAHTYTVIARAHNLVETLRDATAHAEMQAITIACGTLGSKYLNDCTIYVTVEPCPMCAAALGWSQMGEVVYGASDPKKGFSLFESSSIQLRGGLQSRSCSKKGFSLFESSSMAPAPKLLHPKTMVISGICAQEASSLMKRFFSDRR